MHDEPAIELWTLPELAARVALALADDYAGQTSGRVTEVPNPRTLRYYTTLGILDRPAELRGRTAYYGIRHLRQIVAIKRLQAEGLALGEIQLRLHGLEDGAIQAIARVPAVAAARSLSAVSTPGTAPRSFWTTPPAALSAEKAAPSTERANRGIDWQGFPLGEVILLFQPARELDSGDREALRAAAAPLMKVLQTRGLVKPQTEEKS